VEREACEYVMNVAKKSRTRQKWCLKNSESQIGASGGKNRFTCSVGRDDKKPKEKTTRKLASLRCQF
jgi:hypothetical protein